MIYSPEKDKLWDCWIYPHEGKYYMYHLSLSPEQFGKGGWDGISLALSDDLVHWQEYGTVLKKSDDACWIGTGMIQKVGDKFIMNFSEERPAGFQKIYFAVSDDLFNWRRTNDVCEPDGVYYMNSPKETSNSIPRWDSLGIAGESAPYYAFCTANSLKYETPNKSGVLGLLTSEDGLNWKCLPPAFGDTEQFPAFEVPEHLEFGGRHYVTFCTSSYLGYRFDDKAEYMSGGTFYVAADSLQGPYRLPDGDCMLQGTRDNVSVSTVSVGRPLKQGGNYLYYHIWGDNGPDGWVGTVKTIEEEKPYKLVLKYNAINDIMKGTLLTDGNFTKGLEFVKNIGKIPPMEFSFGGGIEFVNSGTSAALRAPKLTGKESGKDKTDLTDGRIAEFDLILTKGTGAGIYFQTKSGRKECVFLNKQKQRLEFGDINDGWGPNLSLYGSHFAAAEIKERSSVKIFIRRCFTEVYINSVYVSSRRSDEDISPNEYGFYFEDASGRLENLRIWQMK